MTRTAIESKGGVAYRGYSKTPPTVGGATPSDRKLKGAGRVYMETEKKSLNAWRKLRGLGALELGEVSGVGSTIVNYLYKGSIPKVDVAEQLAQALGVTSSQVVWGKAEHADADADLPPMPKSPPFDPSDGTPVISDEQMQIAIQWAKAGRSKTDVHKAMGVSHRTFHKAMKKYEEKHGPVMFSRSLPKKATAEAQEKVAEKPKRMPAKKGGKEIPSSQNRKAAKAVS